MDENYEQKSVCLLTGYHGSEASRRSFAPVPSCGKGEQKGELQKEATEFALNGSLYNVVLKQGLLLPMFCVIVQPSPRKGFPLLVGACMQILGRWLLYLYIHKLYKIKIKNKIISYHVSTFDIFPPLYHYTCCFILIKPTC